MTVSPPHRYAEGASEISKGDLEILTIRESDVFRLLQLPALLDGLAEGWDPLESTCRHASLSIL